MTDSQSLRIIEPEALLAQVRELRAQGYRLVQIGATPLGQQLELNYSFDKDHQLLHLRLVLAARAARVPSLTEVYWCAFVYENELHDLFGLRIDGLAVDYQGKFYRTSTPHPFAPAPLTPNPAPGPSPDPNPNRPPTQNQSPAPPPSSSAPQPPSLPTP